VQSDLNEAINNFLTTVIFGNFLWQFFWRFFGDFSAKNTHPVTSTAIKPDPPPFSHVPAGKNPELPA